MPRKGPYSFVNLQLIEEYPQCPPCWVNGRDTNWGPIAWGRDNQATLLRHAPQMSGISDTGSTVHGYGYLRTQIMQYILQKNRPIQHGKTTLLEVLKLIRFLWQKNSTCPMGRTSPGLIKYLNLPAIFPAKARYHRTLPMESITTRLTKMQF